MQAIMCAQSLQGRGTCVQVLHTQFSLYATLSLGRLVYLLSNSYVSTICYATEPRLSAHAPRGKDPVFQGGHSPSEKSCLRQGWAIIFDRGPLTFLKQVRVTPEGAGPKQEVGVWGEEAPWPPFPLGTLALEDAWHVPPPPANQGLGSTGILLLPCEAHTAL